MRAVLVVVLVVLVAAGGYFVWQRGQGPAAPVVPAAAKAKTQVYVMVPQGVFLPVTKVMDKFEKAHPGMAFKLTVDTPEAMAQMVEENKNKPDVFISPGGHEIEVLRQKGYIDPNTMVAFGSYKLAIVVPKANPGKVKDLRDLLNPEVKTISISDPNLNAACYAARQALRNVGVWDELEKAKKIQVTGCCMSSFKWVLDGRAEANVQFLGCPMDEKADVSDADKVMFALKFPTDLSYVPRNVAGILKTAKQRKLAEEFLAFLTAPENVKFMLENRLRDDQNLGAQVGPWGPAQEENPKLRNAQAGRMRKAA
jgi:molybdate transport system substrate-binding protein